MGISLLFHVTLDIPDAVTVYAQASKDRERQYERMFLEVCKGANASGSDRFSCVTEWADFRTRVQAERCYAAMKKAVKVFESLIKNQPTTEGSY